MSSCPAALVQPSLFATHLGARQVSTHNQASLQRLAAGVPCTRCCVLNRNGSGLSCLCCRTAGAPGRQHQHAAQLGPARCGGKVACELLGRQASSLPAHDAMHYQQPTCKQQRAAQDADAPS